MKTNYNVNIRQKIFRKTKFLLSVIHLYSFQMYFVYSIPKIVKLDIINKIVPADIDEK